MSMVLGFFGRIEFDGARDGWAAPAADRIAVPFENQLRLLEFLCGHFLTADFSSD